MGEQGHALIPLVLAATVGLAVFAATARVKALEERLGVRVLSWIPFLFLGWLFSRDAVGIITRPVLQDLQPAFDFGLGWIGFVLGTKLEIRRMDALPASFSSVVAVTSIFPAALTAALCYPLLVGLGGGDEEGLMRTVVILAACAVASASSIGARPERHRLLEGVSGIQEIVAVAGLGLVSVLYRPDVNVIRWTLPASGWLLVVLGLGALLGLVAYVLIRSAHSEAEELALLLGAVALAAGVASYMALSIPVVCAIAGATLINLPMYDAAGLRSILFGIVRPIYLVLLVVIGATWDFGGWQGWLLALAYVLARTLGAGLGAVSARRLDRDELPPVRWLVGALIPQGPIAIVVIVAAAGAWLGPRPVAAHWAVTAVIAGAILSDLVALLARTALRAGPGEPR